MSALDDARLRLLSPRRGERTVATRRPTTKALSAQERAAVSAPITCRVAVCPRCSRRYRVDQLECETCVVREHRLYINNELDIERHWTKDRPVLLWVCVPYDGGLLWIPPGASGSQHVSQSPERRASC